MLILPWMCWRLPACPDLFDMLQFQETVWRWLTECSWVNVPKDDRWVLSGYVSSRFAEPKRLKRAWGWRVNNVRLRIKTISLSKIISGSTLKGQHRLPNVDQPNRILDHFQAIPDGGDCSGSFCELQGLPGSIKQHRESHLVPCTLMVVYVYFQTYVSNPGLDKFWNGGASR